MTTVKVGVMSRNARKYQNVKKQNKTILYAAKAEQRRWFSA